MRVLQLLLHEGIGGMETTAGRLHVRLTEAGLESRTHCLDVGAPHGGMRNTRVRRLRDLRRAVRSFGPDVVLAHSAIPAIYARLLPGTFRVVNVVHSPGYEYASTSVARAERVLRRRSDAVVFVSRAALEAYAARHPPMRDRLLWIPNGVPVPCDVPVARRNPPRELIAVSRLLPSKDLETCIQGFADYVGRHPDARLSIVGDAADPGYESRLRALVDSRPDLSRSVRFLGRRDDVGDLMDRADLLVHASHHESQSLVLAEAAVRGLPVVVTGEVVEVMWWESATRRFRLGDPDDLARVLLSPAAAEDSAMSPDRVRRARQQLDERRMADAYVALLRGLRRS